MASQEVRLLEDDGGGGETWQRVKSKMGIKKTNLKTDVTGKKEWKMLMKQMMDETKTANEEVKKLSQKFNVDQQMMSDGGELMSGGESGKAMDFEVVVENKAKKMNDVTDNGKVGDNFLPSSGSVGIIGSMRSVNDSGVEVLYPVDHVGEVVVLIDTSNSGTMANKRIRNGLYLWERIRDLNILGVKEIKAVGISLYKVFFDGIVNANKCVTSKLLKEKGMRPFIPRTYLETFGVIRDIPKYLTDEEIKNNIEADVTVMSVKRFTRRTLVDGVEGFEPTFSVKVGFKGNDLPREVVLNYTVVRVDHYYPPVRQCHNCGRVGHTQRGCRSDKRCLRCGKKDGCNPSCNIAKCILCGGDDHNSMQRKICPVWAREEQVKKIMTVKNLSRKEVFDSYISQNDNKYSILDNYDENFPAIDNFNKQPKIRNRDQEVNNIMTPAPYNRVVRRSNKPTTRVGNINPRFDQPDLWEAACGGDTLNRPNVNKVSLLERTTTEMLKFMKDFFNRADNKHGLNAIAHFGERLNRIFRDIDGGTDAQCTSEPNGEATTI